MPSKLHQAPLRPISRREFARAATSAAAALVLPACAGNGIGANVATVLESDTLREGIRRQPLTESDVDAGLREALRVAVRESVRLAGRTNGYLSNPDIRIPLPPSLERVETTLRRLGLDNQVDSFVEEMNHGAELAATEATPILTKAIRELTIDDAWDILQGDNTAATQYLREKTDREIYDAFLPIVRGQLERTGAMRSLNRLLAAYQGASLAQEVEIAFTDYTTRKAMDGLFFLMAEQERQIREDPLARTTELLRRVFGPRVYQR